MKQVFTILGEGQLSLTKVVIVVDGDVNVQDFRQVSDALWAKLDAYEGIYLIAPTAQDTLDFTGPAMNTGSRLVLVATSRPNAPQRQTPPPPPPEANEVHKDIIEVSALGKAFLFAQVKDGANKEAVREALTNHGAAKEYLFHILVSSDVPLDDPVLILWGWFTRFDPLRSEERRVGKECRSRWSPER